MYILPAHPALINALDHSGKEILSVFQTSNNSAQYRVLQNELIKNLELGKFTIVVVPDSDDSAIVPKLLANFKLGRLCLIIDDKKPLPDKLHAQIKALSKSNVSKYNPKHYELAKSRSHKKFSALKLHYSFLNQPIFGNRSWKFIASNNSYYSFHEEVCLLKQRLKDYFFEFNQDEYWIMRGRIEEASKLYRPDFDFSAKNDLLNSHTLGQILIEDQVKSLNQFADECRDLSRQFSLFIDAYSRQFYKKGLQEIQHISTVLDSLREDIHNFEVRFGSTRDDQSSNFHERIKEKFSASFKERISARNA
ncbi:MAG: hypothetical protein R3250_09975, partial [Melioribacteraceae bacterium]|nr:hypothetical protein [Melioribacteraceae bacterium]